MNKDLIAIFEYLEREKGIKREIVIEAVPIFPPEVVPFVQKRIRGMKGLA